MPIHIASLVRYFNYFLIIIIDLYILTCLFTSPLYGLQLNEGYWFFLLLNIPVIFINLVTFRILIKTKSLITLLFASFLIGIAYLYEFGFVLS